MAEEHQLAGKDQHNAAKKMRNVLLVLGGTWLNIAQLDFEESLQWR